MSELSDSSILLDGSMSPHAESLIAHAGWVRALARSMVGDPHVADDLTQETYVTALSKPPVQASNLRGWLATILRNLVRQRHRSESRRQHHEAQATRNEDRGSELVEEVSLHKSIVEAVLRLREPYRTAILMRYYEELPPRKIAARLGMPVSTVHTHITRGVEQLRARFDDDYGGRRAWVTALIPLAQPAKAAPLLGAALMQTKMKLAVGAIVLAAGTAVVWPLLGSAEAPPTSSNPTADSLRATAKSESATLPNRPPRERVEAAATTTADGRKQASERVTVSGRLVDANAEPLVGRTVGFFAGGKEVESSPRGEAETGPRGVFDIEIEAVNGQLHIVDPAYRTVLAPLATESVRQGALVVAAPAIPLGGRVVDDDTGRPLEAVALRIELPPGFRTRFADVHDSSANALSRHTSAADGRFTFDDGAFVEGGRLVAESPGYATLELPLPRNGDAGLQLRLRRPERGDDTVTGQVLDHQGRIAPDAWVSLGASTTKTDEHGNFTVEVPEFGPTDRLVAIKPGYQPARLTRADSGEWPANLVLQLGGLPLSIAGRVIDAQGEAVRGAKVWIYDSEFGGRVEGSASTVQGLVLGAPMEYSREAATSSWPFVHAGDDGSFELNGLSERAYVVRAMLEDTLLITDSQPIEAGTTGVELQLPTDAYYPSLSGTVQTLGGVPIADAQIYLSCDAARIRLGDGASTQHQSAQRSRTDENGRFSFERVPRNLVYIRVDHDDILSREFGRGVPGGLGSMIEDAADFLIEVEARIHVRITLTDATRADGFEVHDAAGEVLPINRFQGRSRRTLRRDQILDGDSGIVVIPESATRLVLYKGAEKVEDSALQLVVGQVNEIRR